MLHGLVQGAGGQLVGPRFVESALHDRNEIRSVGGRRQSDLNSSARHTKSVAWRLRVRNRGARRSAMNRGTRVPVRSGLDEALGKWDARP